MSLDSQSPLCPKPKRSRRFWQGENVLLIAPTGTGKTEAVLLPIFSKLVEQKSAEQKGIQVIYITPLRALNRDMLKRLQYWSQKLDITVDVRHGDTEMKIRRKQAKQPPQMLVTTPETLQAILPGSQMRQAPQKRWSLWLWMKCMIWLRANEEHNYRWHWNVCNWLRAENSRESAYQPPSATHKKSPSTSLEPAEKSAIIEASAEKSYRYSVENPSATEKDYELAGKLETSPEAAARIRRILELVDCHQSTLIFVNSRTIAEVLGS